MKYFKQKISLLMVFFFLFTFIPKFEYGVRAEEIIPQADLPVILAGDFIDDVGLGSEWAADNNKALMKEYSDGLYEIVVNFNKAISGQYKVTLNRSWSESYPAQNKSINVPGPQKVIVRYNSKTREVYDSVNDPGRFKTWATLAGTLAQTGGKDWEPADDAYDLEYVGGGFFKKSFNLKAGTYEYKVAYDHRWSNGEVKNNVTLNLAEDKTVTFLANPDLGICTDSEKAPLISGTVSLIGTIRPGTDREWLPEEKGFEFSHLTGDGKYIYSGFLDGGTYEYKVIKDYKWGSGEIPSQGNKTITIPEGGKYVVFIADYTNNDIYNSINDYSKVAELLGLKEGEVVVKSPVINNNATVTFNYKNDNAKEVYLAGSMFGGDWNQTKKPMSKNSKGIWSINLPLNKGDYTYKFVVVYDNGNTEWVADPSNKETVDDGYGGRNSKFTMPEFALSPVANSDGTITFNYNDVTGSASSVQLAGSILDRDWKERRDFTKNGNVWSVTVNQKPGQYTYKFIVNGTWMRDPMNKMATGTGEMDNSIVYVPGFAKIKMPTQIKEGTTLQLIPQAYKLDGTFEDIDPETITWSTNSDAVEVNEKGQLSAVKKVPVGQESIPVQVTGRDSEGNSVTEYIDVVREVTEVEGGRLVILAGSFQSLVPGTSAWDPGARSTRMIYRGNGLYTYTIKNMPAGNYEYKIAMGSWDENYGKNGVRGGENISVSVPKTMDVTFYYSDISHVATDSIKYTPLAVKPVLKGLDRDYTMEDYTLSGVYSVKVALSSGNYSNLKVTVNNKENAIAAFTLTEDKEVTFSYDTSSGWIFSDASNKEINAEAVYFNSRELQYKNPYGAVPEGERITFNIRAAKDDLTQVKLVIIAPDGNKMVDMSKKPLDDKYDIWTCEYEAGSKGMYKYYFLFTNGSQVKAYGDDDGYFGSGKVTGLDSILTYDLNVYDKNFKTPDWMKNAVIYQIFPDRFFNGDTLNDYAQKLARGYLPYEFYSDWYAIPEDPAIENDAGYKGTKGDGQWGNEMYGGDIKGVEAKLDYLQALGVNVLYFNPISASISNHRYDATNYRELDPLLGHMDDFINLAKEAKKRGMHIILDGVFNHVSDDSIYFDRYGKYMAKGKPIGAYQYWSRVYDLMNLEKINQQEAEKKVQEDLRAKGITDFHYKDWFVIENRKVDEGKPTEHYNYEGWWGYDSMPVIQSLNGSEYNVKTWADEIIDGEDSNTRFWLRQGSSGWRLDVANEVSDETWRHFRDAVKEEGDNVIIGEIWTDASKYLLGDMYDSVMNYRFRDAVLGFLSGKEVDAVKAVNMLEMMREQYPKEAFMAMMNLVGSHDTQRIISAFDGYEKSVKAVAEAPSEDAKKIVYLVPLFQMTYPGAPTIYYGDEAGMYGADDPDNRRAMSWGKGDKNLVEWYAMLANIRNQYEVLRMGDISIALPDKNASDIIAFTRNDESSHAVIAINRGAKVDGVSIDVKGAIPNGTKLYDAITGEEYTVSDGRVTVNLPEKFGIILITEFKKVTIKENALRDAYDPKYIVENKVKSETEKKIENAIKKVKETEDEKVIFGPEDVIDREVLILSRALKKSVEFDRGNVKFTIPYENLTDALLQKISGEIYLNSQELQNTTDIEGLLKRNSARIIKAFDFTTNIPGGVFGTKIEVTVAIEDESLKGEKLYVYYNSQNGPVAVAEVLNNDGTITFDVEHFSEYFITDRKLTSINTGNNGSEGTGENSGDGGNQNSGSSGNEDNGRQGSDNYANELEDKLPKTGSPFDAGSISILGFAAISAGGIMVIRSRKRRKDL
ncbi:alpha-amylase family glycosyl hydrolase [Fonticella tunisiensis]|uniref:LPXTG-motif cell wall-anchored protein n=1 Tax=Fonticella tunisiensis TaxID=1096341 RepID=A0A4R7K4I7_9CLOT|nr:alpha-amylase family glycosyl hydrolase [Fonticella tunisiensis]TDT46105.1 LPXTG-motif cell wall-anchored protein [Fonticella tunisiensis]